MTDSSNYVPRRENDVFEVLQTLRAVRRLRNDPVSKDVISSLIYFASLAPSAANRQPWEFVVVTERAQRARIGEIYASASRRLFSRLVESTEVDSTRRIYTDAIYLSDHIGEAPVLVVVCAHVETDRPLTDQLSSIFPAVQNLMVAARAHGLGSTMTTVHKRRDDEIRAVLGLPIDVETVCLVPIGYPQEPSQAFKRTANRRPVEEIVHWERY